MLEISKLSLNPKGFILLGYFFSAAWKVYIFNLKIIKLSFIDSLSIFS